MEENQILSERSLRQKVQIRLMKKTLEKAKKCQEQKEQTIDNKTEESYLNFYFLKQDMKQTEFKNRVSYHNSTELLYQFRALSLHSSFTYDGNINKYESFKFKNQIICQSSQKSIEKQEINPVKSSQLQPFQYSKQNFEEKQYLNIKNDKRIRNKSCHCTLCGNFLLKLYQAPNEHMSDLIKQKNDKIGKKKQKFFQRVSIQVATPLSFQTTEKKIENQPQQNISNNNNSVKSSNIKNSRLSMPSQQPKIRGSVGVSVPEIQAQRKQSDNRKQTENKMLMDIKEEKPQQQQQVKNNSQSILKVIADELTLQKKREMELEREKQRQEKMKIRQVVLQKSTYSILNYKNKQNSILQFKDLYLKQKLELEQYQNLDFIQFKLNKQLSQLGGAPSTDRNYSHERSKLLTQQYSSRNKISLFKTYTNSRHELTRQNSAFNKQNQYVETYLKQNIPNNNNLNNPQKLLSVQEKLNKLSKIKSNHIIYQRMLSEDDFPYSPKYKNQQLSSRQKESLSKQFWNEKVSNQNFNEVFGKNEFVKKEKKIVNFQQDRDDYFNKKSETKINSRFNSPLRSINKISQDDYEFKKCLKKESLHSLPKTVQDEQQQQPQPEVIIPKKKKFNWFTNNQDTLVQGGNAVEVKKKKDPDQFMKLITQKKITNKFVNSFKTMKSIKKQQIQEFEENESPEPVRDIEQNNVNNIEINNFDI